METKRKETRRILHEGRAQWAIINAEGQLILPDGQSIAPEAAVHLAPCEPQKIIAIHANYQSRFDEMGIKVPYPVPSMFAKPLNTLSGHDAIVRIPRECEYVNFEGELAVVIGRQLRNARPEETLESISGYTVTNDFAAQDFREADSGSMLRMKGMDGWSPVGPGLVSGIDIQAQSLRTFRNGQMVQEARISDLLFGIDYMLSDISRFMTLLPGDVVFTGTPAFSRPVSAGDVLEVEVTEVGRLRNRIELFEEPVVDIGAQPSRSEIVRKISLGSDFAKEDGQ